MYIREKQMKGTLCVVHLGAKGVWCKRRWVNEKWVSIMEIRRRTILLMI